MISQRSRFETRDVLTRVSIRSPAEKLFPPTDRALSALLDDLHDRRRQTAIDQVPQAVEGALGLKEVRHHDDEARTAHRGAVIEERLVQR